MCLSIRISLERKDCDQEFHIEVSQDTDKIKPHAHLAFLSNYFFGFISASPFYLS